MEDSGMLTPSDLGLSRSIPEARIAPGNQMGASIDGTRLELYGSHESLQSTLSLKHSIPTALLTVTDYLKFIPEALGKRSYQNRTRGGGGGIKQQTLEILVSRTCFILSCHISCS